MTQKIIENRQLTSGRVLAKSAIWNLTGQAAPMLVAIFAIPLLIQKLGVNRFGVLTLAWTVIGYLSLFDLGLGRALTQLVSEKFGSRNEQEIPSSVWTAMFLMLMMGGLGSIVGILLSPWLVQDILKIPLELQTETLHSFYLLALSIPLVISTTGLQGVLAAQQRFDLINIVRLPMGLFTFLGPLLILPFSQSLTAVVAVLMVGRFFAWIANLLLCLYSLPSLREGITLRRNLLKRLFLFGGWMTVSNIVSPLMVEMDRFLIGALVSVAAVSYYATPYTVVIKLLIIPAALVGVLFPAFSTSFVQDKYRAVQMLNRGIKYVFLTMFPVALLIVTFSHESLDVWLGAEFAQNSTHVLQLLTIGVFITSLAQLPFALIQGAGRPDLTAKLHFIEMVFYLPAVWFAIILFGITGAAVAWTLRVVVDTLLLFVLAKQILPGSSQSIRRMTFMMGLSLLTIVLMTLPAVFAMKIGFVIITLIAFVLCTWFFVLIQDEREVLQKYLKVVRSFVSV